MPRPIKADEKEGGPSSCSGLSRLAGGFHKGLVTWVSILLLASLTMRAVSAVNYIVNVDEF